MKASERVCAILTHDDRLGVCVLPQTQLLFESDLCGFKISSLLVPPEVSVDADDVEEFRDQISLWGGCALVGLGDGARRLKLPCRLSAALAPWRQWL